jgi:hypothetical protein
MKGMMAFDGYSDYRSYFFAWSGRFAPGGSGL